VFPRVAPIGARVGHDQPDAHEVRFPASARGDLSAQAVFSIECSKQLVDVDQRGLHLDHQQVLGSSMPGELVDDAAFAVIAKDTSGSTLHPGVRAINAARLSASREWRRLSNRSSSPPRHRPTISRRTSSAAAMRRIVASDRLPQWPRSISDTVA